MFLAGVWEIICLCSAPFQVKSWIDGATASFPHSWVIFHIPSSQPFNLFWTLRTTNGSTCHLVIVRKFLESSCGWHVAAYTEFECPGSRTSSLCLPVLHPLLAFTSTCHHQCLWQSWSVGFLEQVAGPWCSWRRRVGFWGSYGSSYSTWEASSRPQNSFVNFSPVSIPVLVLGYRGGWS